MGMIFMCASTTLDQSIYGRLSIVVVEVLLFQNRLRMLIGSSWGGTQVSTLESTAFIVKYKSLLSPQSRVPGSLPWR
jgi:hypothetical protein